MPKPKIAIVGAGLCGLTIAQQLLAAEMDVMIVEKSRAIGGRMATRRVDDCVFDHGAQFYKSSDENPFFWHEQWTSDKVSQRWFSEGEIGFYCGANGMNALAKNLAKNLDLQFERKLMRIEFFQSRPCLIFETGENIYCDLVILTAPLPQNLEILQRSQIPYEKELESLNFAKALVGLIQAKTLSKKLKCQFPKGAIYSISNNNSKSIGQDIGLTVVMNPEFSEKHFLMSDQEILDLIHSELASTLQAEIFLPKSQLKKWRFSHPLQKYSKDFIALPSLILGGDAFGGGSLSGAVRSANAIISHVLMLPQQK